MDPDAQRIFKFPKVTCEPFERILNFRDVGKTINRIHGSRIVAEGKIYRSARPDDASIADRTALKEQYGIKTVMDLRTKSEHLKQAEKRRTDRNTPAIFESNEALAEPVKIPGMDYLEININGKGFERSLLWKLRYWSLIKLVVLMVLGYRMQAISILGKEVMQPRGLVGLGLDSIDHSGPEIAQALRTFCASSNTPVLVHCTQGKDRTGLIIALLLFILDVHRDEIAYDYCMSSEALLSEREKRLVEIREIGLTDEFADTPPEWIDEMYAHLNVSYGSINRYLRSIGITKAEEKDIVSNLRA